jgi:transposase-like protein
MKICPRCKSPKIRKDGFMNHKQRFGCGSCKYHFTRLQTELGKDGKSEMIKQAVKLHLENMSYRGIGRLLGVHYQTIINWLRIEADKIDVSEFKLDNTPLVELDEMHLYLGKKKTIAGFG